jgi:hypothetical protein
MTYSLIKRYDTALARRKQSRMTRHPILGWRLRANARRCRTHVRICEHTIIQ